MPDRISIKEKNKKKIAKQLNQNLFKRIRKPFDKFPKKKARNRKTGENRIDSPPRFQHFKKCHDLSGKESGKDRPRGPGYLGEGRVHQLHEGLLRRHAVEPGPARARHGAPTRCVKRIKPFSGLRYQVCKQSPKPQNRLVRTMRRCSNFLRRR